MRIRLALAAGLAVTAAMLAAAPDKRFYAHQQGYLATDYDIRGAVEPAPRPGDARAEADRRIFRETRAMIGGARYALATRDVAITPEALGRDFSCAAGIALTPAAAPATFALIGHAAVDTGRANADAKDWFRRRRPYQIDPGPTCQSPDELKGSYDYPSGHTTYGWTWGYALADLLPERAHALFARARAYGDSRAICGVHNHSAVEAGEAGAAATMTVVRGTARYRADADRARAELRRILADPSAPKPQGCAEEAALIADPAP